MNRFLLLVLIAGLAFLAVLFSNRPELLGDVWIWLIGLIGAIVAFFQGIKHFLKDLLSGGKPNLNKPNSNPSDSFSGCTLKILRFNTDEKATIGLLYVNDSFYCYSLEDAIHSRIPSDAYPVEYSPSGTSNSEHLLHDQEEWFTHHLTVKSGGAAKAFFMYKKLSDVRKPSILVTDTLDMTNPDTLHMNARNTFRRLYVFISQILNSGQKVRVIIKDENWIKNLNSLR